MNLKLQIERLILDGVHLAPEHRPLLQAAVESELARLLAEGGLAAGVKAAGATARMTGGNLQLTPDNPGSMGRQIARAVYGSIGKPQPK